MLEGKREGEVVLVVVIWDREGREIRLLVFSSVLVTGVELPVPDVAVGGSWSTSSAISSSESSSSGRLWEMVDGGGRGRGELVCAWRSWTHCSR